MELSVSDIILQNTPGISKAAPAGVPRTYEWWDGYYKPAGHDAPPSGFSAVTGWGQVYQKAGSPGHFSSYAKVEIGNAKTYVHLKSGEWVLVQDQSNNQIRGAHFLSDFSGNAAIPMQSVAIGKGILAMAAPPAGYNNHFWPGSRGTYAPGSVDGVYIQMDMRVSDANLNLVANVGADWWQSAKAKFVNGFGNNPTAGTSNWVELSTEWKTLAFYSSSTEVFLADPPPGVGSASSEPTPKILSFAPDSGSIGDGVTSASVIQLNGTAEAGSEVSIFDNDRKIGATKADSDGTWILTTQQLSDGIHNFSAKSVDLRGAASAMSSALAVTISTGSTPPPSGTNLLVNGSFEMSDIGIGKWEGVKSVAGWTALSGGTIEMWNSVSGVSAPDGNIFGELDYLGGRDGFYQTIQTTAGQSYELSFDARSRPGLSDTTCAVEVLWNDKIVALVPPGDSWSTYNFAVTGTGGKDRLTFREVADQGSDGLGALYDNIRLVVESNSALLSQYAAGPTSATSALISQSVSDSAVAASKELAPSHE